MSDNALQKRIPSAVKEKGQYVLVLGVIASMLVVAQIPIFVIFFFGVFGYLVLKMLASTTRSDTREIFEFYLSANEILRDDDRKWFGFEINDVIQRGEGIIRKMSAAPPLLHFTLGALYNKAGDHKSAVKYLGNVIERESGDESAFVYPTPELRNYVRVLRKIERDPADAPLTSAAIRALERTRKVRGKVLLEESREKFAHGLPPAAHLPSLDAAMASPHDENPVHVSYADSDTESIHQSFADSNDGRQRGRRKRSKEDDRFTERKPITEVLHDIYDKNVQ